MATLRRNSFKSRKLSVFEICYVQRFVILLASGTIYVCGKNAKRKRQAKNTNVNQPYVYASMGCRHSSVVSSAPTILFPWVQILSTPSTLFFNLYWNCNKKKTKKNKKRPGLAHLKKTIYVCGKNAKRKRQAKNTNVNQPYVYASMGCRHSSVVSSAPTILFPWVQILSTPSTLFFNLYWNCNKKKTKKNKKRPGLAHLKKTIYVCGKNAKRKRRA